jgi:hypothetical protein
MVERIGTGEGAKVRSLQDALRKMRVVSTERQDVLADLSQAEKARLELLAEELADVFKEVPENADIFAFSVAGGEPPRLWIDMTSHVVMARDRRTYRFLKDTRLGRTIILETPSLDDMADCITNYVAERLIERERAIEADWLVTKLREDQAKIAHTPAAELAAAVKPEPKRGNPRLRGVLTFLAGLLVGAAAIVGYAWFQIGH